MQRSTIIAIGSVAAFSVIAVGVPRWTSAMPPPDQPPLRIEIPRSWNIKDIEQAVLPHGAGRVYVLAWAIREDGQRFRTEECLVLKVLDKDDERGRWCFTHLCRLPYDKNPKWIVSMAHVSFEPGHENSPGLMVLHAKRLEAKPTNRLVYDSFGIEELGWSFGQTEGSQFVGCGVCEETWLEAIGEKPTQFFGR